MRREPDHARVSSGFGVVMSLVAVSLLSSCISDPDFASDDRRKALLDLYEARGRYASEDQALYRRAGINRLQLSRDAESGSILLSVDLDQADLSQVMAELLAAPVIKYHASSVQFHGRVSARFSNLPLASAVNTLLHDTGITADMQDGLLNLSYASGSDLIDKISGAQSEDGVQTLSREIVLKHLAAPDVVQLLEDLFPPSDESNRDDFTVGSVAELNAVYLSGPEDVVTEALGVLARADRPVAHVIISALVVDINTSSVESLGMTFSDLSDGSFSIASIIPNTTGGNVVATFEELAGNTAQLTATIKFLAAQNIAQVLSRPYIATRSTMPATIEIVDDQFARVDASSDDSSIITTDSITAGISMNITPIVMADSSIRVDVSIEDSRFKATAGDIVIAKERSAAATSMIVKSGQTIVIGGLNSRYRISEHSGLPWLREIPLLNIFAAEQDALETQTELVVYLTPYIWIPGTDVPKPLQEKLTTDYPDLLSIERLGID